jgi:hypothetical protein
MNGRDNLEGWAWVGGLNSLAAKVVYECMIGFIWVKSGSHNGILSSGFIMGGRILDKADDCCLLKNNTSLWASCNIIHHLRLGLLNGLF